MVGLKQAPDLTLNTTSGAAYSLKKTVQSQSPYTVLAFFKVSCPVCQFTFPYLERLHRAYPDIAIWGISQDDQDASNDFAKSYGCTFPILLDEELNFTVEYGLENVPTIFLINQDMQIKSSINGFVKDELEALGKQLAEVSASPYKPLFSEADQVPAYRPG